MCFFLAISLSIQQTSAENSIYPANYADIVLGLSANNVRYCTAIAATWDNAMDEYVIAWLTDNHLSLKFRAMHTTNYKLEPAKDETISLYPNPAHDHLYASLKHGTNYKIVNTLGATLQKGRTSEIGESVINTSNFPEGRYVLVTDQGNFPFTITK